MSSASQQSSSQRYFSEAELLAFAQQTCLGLGLTLPHAQAIARVVVAGQRDDCQSHGLYRLLTVAHTIQVGKVVLDAVPELTVQGASTIRVDAKFGFSPLAFERGLPELVKGARQAGVAALVINRCVHFSALWPEIEAITEQGLAALALTPSHAWVAPAGGKRPTLGTNPIAFGWPRPGPFPYVFDFATSAIARGDLELHSRAQTSLPPNCGVDANGLPTTDPVKVAQGAMLTFGGYKGSALATMVEIMAGALIGDWNSLQSLDYDNGANAAPTHGELILAFDPARLGGKTLAEQQEMAEGLFATIVDQGARLPSERRYAARLRSQQDGIAVPTTLYEEIVALVDQRGANIL
ncbi:Ldh family oxidoreductase [Alcaligenes endophyticus]|uniref:Ldh family oxidoreductase n=1 Tax=Alcaligenes endophyticus TaxID=1929088 RepID=A0ABT8EGF7_9BURK|nr:Ldh family oxidoreductase [Alcaligenes endophyticus]MCX5589969.1 Ldh family oxidoreductase [Alcaligenes endophyticus]MDN4120368.1 Ldh family oxidoreductase [Alcaligenes endophyticus]